MLSPQDSQGAEGGQLSSVKTRVVSFEGINRTLVDVGTASSSPFKSNQNRFSGIDNVPGAYKKQSSHHFNRSVQNLATQNISTQNLSRTVQNLASQNLSTQNLSRTVQQSSSQNVDSFALKLPVSSKQYKHSVSSSSEPVLSSVQKSTGDFDEKKPSRLNIAVSPSSPIPVPPPPPPIPESIRNLRPGIHPITIRDRGGNLKRVRVGRIIWPPLIEPEVKPEFEVGRLQIHELKISDQPVIRKSTQDVRLKISEKIAAAQKNVVVGIELERKRIINGIPPPPPPPPLKQVC